ncbi:helix-turn-helix domain-containing protein [Williamsia sp. CHRR-6]|uniref:TetR/AcrR family transcriptional regulator n=1 Tax=Williamsia sp. CHRR-6 TaxID=2835871 RepID=UPI0027DCA22E|nr:helix-turn-helix domain-containing protein [Williamsia sp. CHRR-6]
MVTTDTEAPRFSRLEPDERRTQILRSAVRLFASQPYSKVSMSDVAEAAGVARGLLHHYFGGKRGLYLEVLRYMVIVPPLDTVTLPSGSLEERVSGCVRWLTGVIEVHGHTWVTMVGGTGADVEVDAILDEADDLAANRVLEAIAFAGSDSERAVMVAHIRAFGGLVKAAGREWMERHSLTRSQVEALLTETLLAIVRMAPQSDRGSTISA